MFKFFRKHRTLVMVSLAVCVVGLLFFGIGTTSLLPSANDVILKINGQKVRQLQFDRLYKQLLRQNPNASQTNQQQLYGQALNELIREEVFYQESKNYGIQVTDQELQMQIANLPAFQKDGRFDQETYYRMIYQSFSLTPADFEKTFRKDLSGRKVNQLIATAVHISDDRLMGALGAQLQRETDPKKRKELASNPEILREELLKQETNLVFSDWLNNLNSNLKVDIVSDTFRKNLNAPAAAPGS